MTFRIMGCSVSLALFVATACSSNGGDTSGAGGAPGGGAGGAVVGGAGGVPAGGAPAAGMTAMGGGTTAMGGGTSMGAGGAVSAGQLMCGGKLCHAGGHCAAGNTCPAFLGTCFTSTDFQTCDAYCGGAGFTCAEKSCNADGTPISGGFTNVSFAAANKAMCQNNAFPDTTSFDVCSAPIWLSAQKPRDDVVRCCCRG